MEQAKSTVEEFVSKHGHHDTTVHEHHKPAVVHEHVTPTRHEEAITAIDREVHQEHHHTTVQPIRDREVLPEEHHHNIVPVEHKEHRHGDPNLTKERLEQEAAQFKHVSETGKTEHTHSVAPVVAGEHIHHHVHEYIQPIIQKETIQPSVVHTVIPIHEVHHNEAKHHAASALPAVSMADWKKKGGSLEAHEGRTNFFKGQPQEESAEQHGHHSGPHMHSIGSSKNAGPTTATTATTTNTTTSTAGAHNSSLLNKADPEIDSNTHKSHTGRDAALVGGAGVGTAAAVGSTHDRDTTTTRTAPTSSKLDPRVDSIDGSRSSMGTDSAPASAGTDRTSLSSPRENKYADTHLGSKMDERNTPATSTTTTGRSNMEAANVTKNTLHKNPPEETPRKPSLLQRLNPLKDADGDGRKGIMR